VTAAPDTAALAAGCAYCRDGELPVGLDEHGRPACWDHAVPVGVAAQRVRLEEVIPPGPEYDGLRAVLARVRAWRVHDREHCPNSARAW
jgi:hypothetical protein